MSHSLPLFVVGILFALFVTMVWVGMIVGELFCVC
jgi:hypothetical protein